MLGADYDTEHRMRRWWTADDTERFQVLTQPLADQFAAYQPLPGLSINGTLTLTENIADLGGLAAAFDAYRATLGSRATDTDYVREQDREFFIAFAQTLRRKISEGALRTQVATSDHAPEDYRADTVRNLDACTTRSTCARGSVLSRALGARAGLVASPAATMRVTVCELPHEPQPWPSRGPLCASTRFATRPSCTLPEFAMVDPLWQDERFDAERWAAAEALSDVWRHRL